jgi:cytoskeletal protein RodZ
MAHFSNVSKVVCCAVALLALFGAGGLFYRYQQAEPDKSLPKSSHSAKSVLPHAAAAAASVKLSSSVKEGPLGRAKAFLFGDTRRIVASSIAIVVVVLGIVAAVTVSVMYYINQAEQASKFADVKRDIEAKVVKADKSKPLSSHSSRTRSYRRGEAL